MPPTEQPQRPDQQTDPAVDQVNQLREQLRALGYLDARVDRFVLGRVASARQARTAAVGASLRIGALAGLLLGPAAAVGLATRMPGLVTSLTDALVLACYLAVLFGFASALLALCAVSVAGALARRVADAPTFADTARRAAIGAGLSVSLVCLLYLTLWWQATSAGAPIAPWGGAQILVLTVAAAISVLIGHTVTVTVLATLVRWGLAPALRDDVNRLPGSPLSSWRVLLPLGATAVLGAIALLAATAPRQGETPRPPALTVVPTGTRVVVVAIDGVDTSTLSRLTAAGELPTLARLTTQARATIDNDPDRDPARVWTTIATGQPPERHGIRTLEARQLAGVEGRLRSESAGMAMLTAATDLLRLTTPSIASGEERRVPTFWEVAAAAGLRTAVVHWWATWPATDTDGIVLSDRAILRLEQGGELAGEIAPASVYDTLRADTEARHARVSSLAAQAWPGSPDGDVATLLTRSAELDATVLDLAADPALGTSDLRVVYLPGLDIAQHGLLQSLGTPLGAQAAADRVQGIEHYYRFLDAALGHWLERLGDAHRQVVVITQPGRVQEPSPGWLSVSGDYASDTTALAAAPTGVAPTVLTLLGVPMAGDGASPALRPLLGESFLAQYPERTVATYGERRSAGAARTGQPLNREMIERMRSLGYVR